MRVLYLNPFSQEVSGPDESLRTLMAQLIPRGLEAHVVLPAPGPQVARYEALGAFVHFAPLAALRRDLSLDTLRLPGRLLRATWVIRALARRLAVDLIHTNMEVLLEGGFAARALGLPHVLHYRGNTLDRPKPVFDALTALWTATADRVFCISGATADVFRRRGHLNKTEVLYNPVDVERFQAAARSTEMRAAMGAGPDDKLIGTVCRIHPRKDLATFIKAAAQVAAKVPSARFAIVGAADGPAEDSYRAELVRLVTELRLEDRLVFTGARREVPEVMRALDIFVLSSRHEGFGRVVAEAMAAGRPMVVTDEGAPPELVDHGRFGLCATPEDPNAFAARILELLDDPARASRLGTDAAAAADAFDSRKVADRVWARYRELAGFK